MDVFSLYAKIGLDTSEYDKGLAGASQKTNSFGSKLKSFLSSAAKTGAAALGGATAALTAFGVSSVKTGAQFDSSMSQVAATMGTTVDNIQELRDFAMDMGAKTAFSATQAADALNYMALAGYDADEAMAALPNVLNLAAAGNIELAAASDMVTDAQSALGLSMEESAELVDKMAMTASKSNTSVGQLGEAMLTVGGTAKNLSGGTTELATALGILADNGIKGSEGGTALRNVILSLTAPTEKAAGFIDELGIKVFDAEGKMRPLNETFADLNAALSNMTQGERTQVLNEIFNKVDLKSVEALLANTGERFNELSGYIDNATGSAEKMAAVQLDNLAGDITLFKSALEGAQIVISDSLTPSLRDFVKFGANAVSTLSTAFQEGGLSGAMEAFGTILSDGLNMIVENLPSMVEAGMQLIGALGQGLLDNTDTIFSAATKIIVILVDGISSALPGLANSAVEIVTSLANNIGEALPELIPKAVEAIALFAQNLTSPDSIDKMREGAENLINGLIAGIGNAIPILVEYAPEILANLMSAMVPDVERLKSIAETLVNELGPALQEAMEKLPESLEKAKDTIIEGLKSIFGDEAVEGAVESLSGVWDNISNGAVEAWNSIQSAWNGAVEFFTPIAEGIVSALAPVVEGLGVGLISAWEGIQSAWNGAVEFFSGVWDGIQSVFSDVAGVLGPLFSSAWEAVQAAWNVATEFFSGVWEGIQAAFEPAAEFFGEKFNAAWEAVQTAWNVATEFFSSIWEGIQAAFEPAAEFFGEKFNAAWEAIRDAFSGVGEFFTGIFDDIKDSFTSIGDDAHQWGEDLVNNFVDGINSMIGGVRDAVSGIANTVRSFIGFSEPDKGPLSNFHTYAPDMMKLFAQGITDNADLLKTAFNNSLNFAQMAPVAAMDYNIPISQYSPRSGGNSSGVSEGGVVINQTIYAAEQSPIELAANTRAAFQRARWAT